MNKTASPLCPAPRRGRARPPAAFLRASAACNAAAAPPSWLQRRSTSLPPSRSSPPRPCTFGGLLRFRGRRAYCRRRFSSSNSARRQPRSSPCSRPFLGLEPSRSAADLSVGGGMPRIALGARRRPLLGPPAGALTSRPPKRAAASWAGGRGFAIGLWLQRSSFVSFCAWPHSPKSRQLCRGDRRQWCGADGQLHGLFWLAPRRRGAVATQLFDTSTAAIEPPSATSTAPGAPEDPRRAEVLTNTGAAAALLLPVVCSPDTRAGRILLPATRLRDRSGGVARGSFRRVPKLPTLEPNSGGARQHGARPW